ncbi:hypothetical protein CFP56_027447 [Quercus suber]|uniref:SLH domain-containing protein n=1 Tax=Quercus suber TaxID=58331 RepID=A0AAW0JWY8_QUESU
MASATWSPSSLQLRLALNCRNCRKSPAILVRMQLGNPGRQIRVFCVAQDEARNENGVERRRNEDPLVGSDSTANGFSGWSESESDPVDSQSNKWFGGVVGAGVVGVILVSGLAFAAFSLSKRNGLKPDQRMKPLTTEQEVLLASDDQNDSVKEDGNAGGNVPEDTSLENSKGTYKDSSSPEFDETPKELSSELTENPFDVKPTNSLVSDGNPSDLNTEPQDEMHDSSFSTMTPIVNEPVALNLRLALNCRNCRKSPAILVRMQLGNPGRHIRVFCVAQDEARNENGVERRRNEGPLVGSDSTDNGFSGWSGSESDPVDSQSNKWFGGVVGAGVVGVILVSGLAFAAFSLSKRNGLKPDQHMKPLTTEQEVLLASDDQNDSVKEDGNAGGNVPEDTSLENSKGTYKDSSSPEFDETPKSKNFGDSFVAGTEELSSELTENPFDVKPTNLLVSDGNPSDLNTEPLDEMHDSSFSTMTPIVNEPVALNVSVNSQSDSTFDTQNLPKNDLDTLAPPSTEESPDLSKTTLVSAEKNSSSLDNRNYSESELSENSQSEFTYPLANDANYNNEMNRSRSESSNLVNSFSYAGIPAPSVVSAALQVLPGKVLIPATVDQVQGQALAALQVLKVIEADVQPGDLCTRREYARWLVSASSALSRNTTSKVYPAMYIENVSELAFDDITPKDPDFSSIQGLAEAGLIASKLSRKDMLSSLDEDQSPFYFSPESPLSRQDLISWKMALEKRQLPEADRKRLHQISGFIDIDKIHPDACPALVADISAGEQGIIALAFGYTRLFQPDKPVTNAQAAIALATGEASDSVSEELARIEAESMAENAVAAHTALVAEVEKDVNASFEKELSLEREKIDAVQKMAEEARCELEKLRADREIENIALMKERAAVESEMEVLLRLRREVEEQLQSLMSNKAEISYEKERISQLRKEAENENQEISRLQYELEVERKALSMARAWAEDEAKRANEQAKALEEARDRWERQGIKVVVDDDLREETTAVYQHKTCSKALQNLA